MAQNRQSLKDPMFAFLMNYKGIISSALFVLIILFSILVGPGCANVVPPAGGPRDSIAPLLLKISPADSTRNFSGNRIVISFDEYVEVQNIQENLIVSPLARITPQVEYRLNTVTVRLRDTLEPNTTYSLNFGQAIRDINEANVLQGFTYTFSTGPYIDSLLLSGKVVLAETGKIDTTLIVMLHTEADDSLLIKQKPRYITKLDGQGNFIFRNLPPRPFYIYALKDEGGTRRYLSDKQLFAFANSSVTPSLSPDSIVLFAYARPDNKAPAATAQLGNAPRGRQGTGATDKRLRIQTNLMNGMQDLLSELFLSFDQPLKTFDSTKIRLYTDSAFNAAPPYRFIKDSTNRRIDLITSWKENTLYHIIMDKDFAEDSTGKKLLKTDTLHFTTKKLSEYASLQLRFRSIDMAQNPVLQLVSNDVIYKSYPLTGPEFSQPLFLPGEYEMRILFDLNKNGQWDPGEFFGKRRQPEIVRPVQRRITVKAGIHNDFEIAL
jgi:hypothetical protein